MEDAKKSIWSNNKSFVLPVSQMNFVSCSHLWMATNGSGEVWLGKKHPHKAKPTLLVAYDSEMDKDYYKDWNESTAFAYMYYWDDMESIMY